MDGGGFFFLNVKFNLLAFTLNLGGRFCKFPPHQLKWWPTGTHLVMKPWKVYLARVSNKIHGGANVLSLDSNEVQKENGV